MLLSILTPTLIERRERFQNLKDKLDQQIQDSLYTDRVEHLIFEDDREQSIGFKRNVLMDKAKGTFIVFVDDDDDVSDRYVHLICDAIEQHPDIDCIGLKGQITFKGAHPQPFVHCLQYTHYFKKQGKYFRPPLHINPIRREIAVQYRFENISYSEDIDWALRMLRDHALKTEAFIDACLYYYDSPRHWRYQRLIDATETIRRIFGLQRVNRVRLDRWIKEKIRS